jgi:lipoate-protein ligase A
MGNLSEALKAEKDRFTDRAVKSVQSHVTNIRDHLEEPGDVDTFQETILNHMLRMPGNSAYQFSEADVTEIKGLRDSKFSTWEWNFGYSPKYQFNKSISVGAGRLDFHMNVEKGIVRELKILGDYLSLKDIAVLEQALAGTIHDPETIRNKLAGLQVSEYIVGLDNEEFLSGMF